MIDWTILGYQLLEFRDFHNSSSTCYTHGWHGLEYWPQHP